MMSNFPIDIEYGYYKHLHFLYIVAFVFPIAV